MRLGAKVSLFVGFECDSATNHCTLPREGRDANFIKKNIHDISIDAVLALISREREPPFKLDAGPFSALGDAIKTSLARAAVYGPPGHPSIFITNTIESLASNPFSEGRTDIGSCHWILAVWDVYVVEGEGEGEKMWMKLILRRAARTRKIALCVMLDLEEVGSRKMTQAILMLGTYSYLRAIAILLARAGGAVSSHLKACIVVVNGRSDGLRASKT